jgi:hypothetical protein
MDARRVVAVGLGCLLVGAALSRLFLYSAGVDAERKAKQAAAENRALKKRVEQLPDEPSASVETERVSPRVAPGPAEPAVVAAAPEPAPNTRPGKSMQACMAAKLLGLEPGRRRQLEDLYSRVLFKVREAESRHATVLRQGNDVEIHIPPFPSEAAILRQEWSGLLLSALTPQEMERYTELQLDELLFPREIGIWDRYMVYQPQDVVWPKLENGNRSWPTFYERWTKPGDQVIDASTRWPWGGPDAYSCYRHLLDPADCKVREE